MPFLISGMQHEAGTPALQSLPVWDGASEADAQSTQGAVAHADTEVAAASRPESPQPSSPPQPPVSNPIESPGRHEPESTTSPGNIAAATGAAFVWSVLAAHAYLFIFGVPAYYQTPSMALHRESLMARSAHACSDPGNLHAHFVHSLYGTQDNHRDGSSDGTTAGQGTSSAPALTRWPPFAHAIVDPFGWSRVTGLVGRAEDASSFRDSNAVHQAPFPVRQDDRVHIAVVYRDHQGHVPLRPWLRGVVTHSLAPIRVPSGVLDVIATTTGLCAPLPLIVTEALLYPPLADATVHAATTTIPLAHAMALHPPTPSDSLYIRETRQAFVLIDALATNPGTAFALCNPSSSGSPDSAQTTSSAQTSAHLGVRKRTIRGAVCTLHFVDSSVFVFERAPDANDTIAFS